MMPGRKPKPQIDELRAISWHWAMKRAVTEDLRTRLTADQLANFLRTELTDEQLAELLGAMFPSRRVLGDAIQIGRYRRGLKNPGKETLECIEERYAGTRMFFESGPWFSHFWPALDPRSNPQDALTMIESTWQNAIHVEHEIRIGDEQGIQDVVIPQELAVRWELKPGARLNLLEKCQSWESVNDLCGQVLPSVGVHEIYSSGGILTLAPTITFTKDERVKEWSKIRLPFFAGLSYRIAQARIKNENRFIINPAAESSITEFSGDLLHRLLPKLPDTMGVDIVVEHGIPIAHVPLTKDLGQ